MDDEAAKPTSSVPQRNWELSNEVEVLDSIYEYNDAQQEEMRNAKPWDKDPNYFTNVKISAIALLKMVMHAKRGGNLEVMGLMQGRVDANSFIIIDTFALPVEGTETRVNAQGQAYEYMSVYSDLNDAEGRKEKVVGWYHSHPGYGCWLSGIDVSTQLLNQKFQEPWVAIVIDPLRTMSAGKVEIGAFRTYPEGYKPPDDVPSEYQSIPLNKIEDFGVHASRYYSLDTSFFKSKLDSSILTSLWNTYWISTLSTSPIFSNAEFINNQMLDIGKKLKEIDQKLQRSDRHGEVPDALKRISTDANVVADELDAGRIAQFMKRALFDRNHTCCRRQIEMSRTAAPVGSSPAETTEPAPQVDCEMREV